MLDAPMTWVLQRDVFANGDCIRSAASEAGHRVVEWSDEWWASSRWPLLDAPVLFHGSLGNAARIPGVVPWKPGVYCDTARFHCSTWYRAVAKWLLHERWEVLPASRFVRDVDAGTGGLLLQTTRTSRWSSPPFVRWHESGVTSSRAGR